MKVLILIPCLLRGGTELQTLSMARALRSCGHAVIAACYFEYEPAMIKEFEKAGTNVMLLDMSRKSGIIRFIFKLRKVIKSVDPDIVHVQYMAPGALPIIAARLAGVKTIYATVHQPYTKSHGWMSKMILRTASLFTTRFIAVSRNAEKSWFGSSSLFDEKKPLKLNPHHFTIYNNVDTDKIQELVRDTDSKVLRNQLKIPQDELLIGTVSRLRHEKGIDLLVEAFNLLKKEIANAHLLIAGDGPDKNKLEELAVSLGIRDRITFYGMVDWEQGIKLVTLMDIVVVPSRFEGFGLTAAEAMAAGKPVISSDSFGLKEIIIDNVTGIVFPINDIHALRSAMKRLYNKHELREKLSVAGKERVISTFGYDLYKGKIHSLYHSQP